MTKKHPFPIVAIGVTVGSLSALRALLENLSSKTGMAFIYMRHLSPDSESYFSSLLPSLTTMNVQDLESMEQIVPNNVYVIPFNKGIEVADGHMQLIPRSKTDKLLSMDILFSSLAKTYTENVIGVVLSGDSSDGKEGFKAIKDAGGITFVQDSLAVTAGMPSSEIAPRVADYILSPEEIARELLQINRTGVLKHKVNEKYN